VAELVKNGQVPTPAAVARTLGWPVGGRLYGVVAGYRDLVAIGIETATVGELEVSDTCAGLLALLAAPPKVAGECPISRARADGVVAALVRVRARAGGDVQFEAAMGRAFLAALRDQGIAVPARVAVSTDDLRSGHELVNWATIGKHARVTEIEKLKDGTVIVRAEGCPDFRTSPQVEVFVTARSHEAVS
jgi:hypothetical protein